MSTIVLTDERFLDHDPGPGHVESPARLDAIMSEIGRAPIDDVTVETPRAATDEEIEAVHPRAYRELLAGFAGRYATLDPDTGVSPGSWEAATLAAGAAVVGVESVMTGRADNAFALVRPPGHHATPTRACHRTASTAAVRRPRALPSRTRCSCCSAPNPCPSAR